MPQKTLLKLKNLTIEFGGLKAVNNVNFNLYEGEIVGIIGPNGAGKTTVFNLISGVYQPTNGQVMVFGEDITGLKPHKLCEMGVGRTHQVVKPFPNKSVLYNVMVGSFLRNSNIEKAKEKAMEVLTLIGLEREKDIFAKSLTIAKRKQLELARALATEPKILLLDEVLAGLTPTEVEDAIKLIRKINQTGITIILIEHVLQAAMALSQRIMVLDYGVKIAEGTPEEISSDPEVIKAYLGDKYGTA